MAIIYNLPSKWDSLNDFQLEKISRILLSSLSQSQKDMWILFFFVCKKWNFRYIFRAFYFFYKASLIDVIPLVGFIYKNSSRTKFPKIKNMVAPKDRLGDITVEQLGLAIKYYNEYNRSLEKIDAIRLASILYLPLETKYSKFNLSEISTILEKLTDAKIHSIYIAFSGSLSFLAKKHPKFFPKKPIKTQNNNYSWASLEMQVANQKNPFGKLKDIRQANAHDFLNHLKELKQKDAK